MTLIKSISGIRGTIGGKAGDNLTPVDIVKFAAAYGSILQSDNGKAQIKVVIGRDARKSGPMVCDLVASTLVGLGIDVIDLGLSTTPTVEIAVPEEKADGGIIITASHNPGQWNALKLLNEEGEFISSDAGKKVIDLADSLDLDFAPIDKLGSLKQNDSYLQRHIDLVVQHPLVDREVIANANFTVAVDAVNSSGGIFVPLLLEALGVSTIEKLYCTPSGDFPHNPEPLPKHLTVLSAKVVERRCDLGITVDPDVDRLAFVSEDGNVFGEEYTLVAVADYVLSQEKGNTVSNLSSTRALKDVTEKHGGEYYASAVGEVNVVNKMREVDAVIGGEGNGGIIDPKLHYGRDALVGIGLFLTHLAKSGMKMSELRTSYPSYYMSKNKIQLTPSINVDHILDKMASKYADQHVNTIDGVKVDFPEEWVHLRKSNTEPIIRIYTEAKSPEAAESLAQRVMDEIGAMIS